MTEGARQKNEVADDPEADGMMVIGAFAFSFLSFPPFSPPFLAFNVCANSVKLTPSPFSHPTESSTSLTDQSAPPDPFAALEKSTTQKTRALSTSARLSALHASNATSWDDPFSASQKLRAAFREKKKGILESEGRAEAVKERFALGGRVRVEDLRTPKMGSREAEEEREEWERVRRERERGGSDGRGKRRREEETLDIPSATPRVGGGGAKRLRASLPSSLSSSRKIAGLPSSSSSSRRQSFPSASSHRDSPTRSPSTSTSLASPKPSSAALALHSKLALASRLKRDPFASPPSGLAGRTGMSSSRSAPAGLAGLAGGGGGGGAGGKEGGAKVKVRRVR